MKILVIDDNPSIVRMVSQFLEMKGHECTSTNDGRNGLELIKQNQYDRIILDIAMPEFNGFDIVNALANGNTKKIRQIIVLTALNLTPSQKELLFKKGVKAIYKKPVEPQVLLDAVMP